VAAFIIFTVNERHCGYHYKISMAAVICLEHNFIPSGGPLNNRADQFSQLELRPNPGLFAIGLDFAEATKLKRYVLFIVY
jgi:hypothetical protein